MRALFRIRGIAELSQDEIHALADKALRAIDGDVFFHDSHDVLNDFAEKYSITLVSYLPEAQLEAMARVAGIHHCFGADTFEQYEMNPRYFEMLLIRLKARPEDCIYIDKQAQVLEAASKLGVKTCLAQNGIRVWMHVLKNSL
jgi:FMN phosphatase YigB (HAD superfamily)